MKKGMLKINFVLGAVALFLILLLGRVYFLQCTDQKEYNERKQNQLRSTVKVEAKRGQICDRRGSILALSTTSPMLWCDPKIITEKEQEARLISEVSEIGFEDVMKKMAPTNLRYSVIARGLMDTESHKIRALISQKKLPGVYVKYEEKRVYPKHDLFGVQIGFCDNDGKGAFGVEKGAEYYLSGIDGWNTVWRDNRRRSFFTMKNVDMIFDPMDGQNIYLTIDEKLQQICQEELLKAAEEFTPQRAGIILLDPKSGEILAMASWPFFDPNERSEYKEGVFNNLLLSDPFEPGSIMKPVSGSLSLNEGIVNLASPVDCENGSWVITKHRTLHDDHKLGTVSFKEVIKYSSNIGVAKVSEMLGPEKLYEGLRSFGFGSKSNLKVLEGESSGRLQNYKKWSGTSIHSIPMGQEISVTALQMACAYATIANRGTRMRPNIVKRITMPDGSVSPEAREFNYFEPTAAEKNVISEKAALDMTDAMVSVTDDDGTGRLVKIPGYKVAGKTGTGQKWDAELKQYSKKNYVASFAGFVPAYDPKLVCIVVVDSPRGKIYGGTVAAPIFREVCKSALEYLQVPADYETEIEEESNNSEANYAVE
ncbi:penicillin-binding protein 2 [bacterium]|nr:penicillin-binding protein 2 [bacterium]